MHCPLNSGVILELNALSPKSVTEIRHRNPPPKSATLDALAALPSNRLEALGGDRAGQYSIRVNEQWRICFEWRDGDAYNVEIVDYHH